METSLQELAAQARAELDQEQGRAAPAPGIGPDIVSGSQERVSELAGGPVQAAAAGALRGLTGPLYDLYSRAEGTAPLEQARREEHPIASGLGEVAGYATGALYGTGLGGILSAAGKGIGRKVADAAGSKALGALSTGLVEGAGIGISEGTTKSALDVDIGIPGAAAQIMESAGMGAAMGGGMSLFGHSLSKAANWAFKRGFAPQLKKAAKAKSSLEEANRKYNAVKAEIEAIESSMTPEQIAALRSMEGPGGYGPGRYSELVGTEGSTGRAQNVGGKSVSMVESAGGSSKKSELWESVNALERADDALRSATDRAMTEASKQGSDLAQNIGFAAMAASGHGGMGMASRLFMPKLNAAIGDYILGGMSKVSALRKTLGSSLKAGHLTSERQFFQGGAWHSVENKAMSSTKNIAKAFRVPPMRYMTNSEFREIMDEVDNADIGSYESGLRMSLASQGIPQELANEHVRSQIKAVEYLKTVAPRPKDNEWVADTNQSPMIPTEQLIRFSRRLRAAMIPMSVMSDFVSGELTHEAADTWWNVYPEIAQEFSDTISMHVETALAHGKKFSPKEQFGISLMVSPEQRLLGRRRSFDLIQSLQQNYAQETNENMKAAQSAGGGKIDQSALTGVNDSYLSRSQALSKGVKR